MQTFQSTFRKIFKYILNMFKILLEFFLKSKLYYLPTNRVMIKMIIYSKVFPLMEKESMEFKSKSEI